MKTKDLVYVGVIAYLAYLIMKKKPLSSSAQATQLTGTTPNSATLPNGGLNLGQNMDLPNLTPTPANGLSTEVALNSSNITPLIKDDGSGSNEPTQVFGNYNLPTPYSSSSTINPNPTDVVSNSSSNDSSNEPTQVFGNYNLPTPYSSTSIIVPNPVDVIPTTTATTTSSTPSPVVTSPVLQTITSPSAEASTIDNITLISPRPLLASQPKSLATVSQLETNSDLPKSVITQPVLGNSDVTMVSEPLILPKPTVSGTSVISEPLLSTKSSASLQEPFLGFISENAKDGLISQCGSSFSLPNNDKEGSYTNYWYDGQTFFMQTTSPMMMTVANKITKDAFIEGCKKFQSFKYQNASR